MFDRATSSHPDHSDALSRGLAPALAVVIFAAVLLFGILVALRFAYGWAEVVSEGAAVAIPMAADGLVSFALAVGTAAGAVWLYVKRLAH